MMVQPSMVQPLPEPCALAHHHIPIACDRWFWYVVCMKQKWKSFCPSSRIGIETFFFLLTQESLMSQQQGHKQTQMDQGDLDDLEFVKK